MDNAIVSPLYVVKTHVLPVSIKTVDANARVLRFAISDQRRDRDEDVVRQRGLDKRNYRPNPLVYWAHQGDFVRAPDQLPIAKAVSVEVGDVKGLPTTFADKLFVPEEVGYELSRLTYDLARLGFINCCSIGFMRRKIAAVPKEYWTAEEQKAGKAERGYLIVDSELVESSLCGIPSNVGALAQRGLAPNPEWDVDRVREVARKHLEGAALDRFIGELTGPEVLTLRAVKPEEAPEPLRELLVKAAARFEDVDDLGFDDYELHVGKARPVEATKAADPEPEPEDTDPPVAPVVTAKATDAAVVGDVVGLGIVIGLLNVAVERLGAVAGRLDAACSRMEACCADMEADDAPEPADGMKMASFVAEVTKRLDAFGVRIEDGLAEFHLDRLADRAVLSKSTHAPHDTRSDPAPRVEAAKPPVAAAVKQPQVDASALASLVPLIAKALEPIQEAAADRAVYKARGGVEIP